MYRPELLQRLVIKFFSILRKIIIRNTVIVCTANRKAAKIDINQIQDQTQTAPVPNEARKFQTLINVFFYGGGGGGG